MSAQFATLLGYTHDEVKKFFPDWIEKLAKVLNVTNDEAFDEIVKWYDGYKFHHSAEPVINPVSLGLCLRDSEFKTYWSSTAVPTFLIDILKNDPRPAYHKDEREYGFFFADYEIKFIVENDELKITEIR